MLVKNVTLVKSSKDVVQDACVVVNKSGVVDFAGKCADFGVDKWNDGPVVDGGGKLLLPGLINCHDHFYGRGATGLSLKDDPPSCFREILERLWWKLDRALTLEAVHLSALVCLIEAIEAGTTTVFDHHSSPQAVDGSLDAIANAVLKVGMRANLCYEVSDRNGFLNSAQSLQENIRFSSLQHSGGGRLSSKMGLHAAFTCSDETLAASASSSIGVHVHVSEGPEDVGAIQRLNNAGLLNAKAFLGHCVHVSDQDIDVIKKSGATVTIQVESNLNNQVGLPPMKKFLDANIPVVFGTDGMTQDMLQEFRCAMLQFPFLGTRSTEILLDRASEVASDNFSVPIGKLDKGYAADMVLFDYVPSSPLTANNLPWHLQFSAKRVESVWVGGKQLVQNGSIHIAGIDKGSVFREFRSVLERVVWVSPELNRFPQLPSTESSIFGRDFLRTWEFSRVELLQVLRTAQQIRTRHAQGKSCALLPRAGLALSVFRDKSTRTRLAYSSAAALLGLQAFVFDETQSQIAHGETIRETAVMTSLVTESIGIRDDLFLGVGESYMRSFADALIESRKAGGVFPRNCPRPNLLNLQSDFDHPTQTLSDLLHLQSVFGPIMNNALRGKRVCVSWAYSPSYGKPLSVPGGLIALLPRFGVHVTLAHPPGFELQPEVMEAARRGAEEGNGAFRVVHSMLEGVTDADVVYAKSWGSMQFMLDRVATLKDGKAAVDSSKEKEALEKLTPLAADWEYNEEKRKSTHNGSALYMHCLPADISGENVRQGEVARPTFERDRINTYREASWKPYVCAAIVALQRNQSLLF